MLNDIMSLKETEKYKPMSFVLTPSLNMDTFRICKYLSTFLTIDKIRKSKYGKKNYETSKGKYAPSTRPAGIARPVRPAERDYIKS